VCSIARRRLCNRWRVDISAAPSAKILSG
jgi:hypothetical protein